MVKFSISGGRDFTSTIISFLVGYMLVTAIGGVLHLTILGYSVRYAFKKYAVGNLSVIYIVLAVASFWVYNEYFYIIIILLTAGFTQVLSSLHGSQVPFIATTALYPLSEHLSIFMSMITTCCYPYFKRMFDDYDGDGDYLNMSFMNLRSFHEGEEVEKPEESMYILTGMALFGLLTLVPYGGVTKHVPKNNCT